MPFNPNNWTSTSGKIGHTRSTDLVRIDAALNQYLLGKSAQRLKAVVRAVLDWQATKVPWTASLRRVAMIELINYLKVEAVTQLPAADQDLFSYVYCEPKITLLSNDPRRLMRECPLYIGGAPADGVASFKLQYVSGDPSFDYGPLIPGATMTAGAQVKYNMRPDVRGPAMSAVSIMMHTDVNNLTTGPTIEGKLFRLTGASNMSTGQLSGCSFITRERNGHLECTHIKPNGFGGDGVPLQDHLETLDLGDNVSIYGRKNYPNQNGGGEIRVAIVGRRGPHGWEIYAQRFLHGTSIVTGIDTLWPRPH